MTSSLIKVTQESEYQGQYQRTIEFHEQQLSIAQESGDRAGEAVSLNNLGMAYHCLGQYKEAIDYYGHSLEIERQLSVSEAGKSSVHRAGEARVWGNLGNVYHSLGQYHKAIKFHQQSLAIRRELGDNRGLVASLNHLGKACCCLGQYQQAIDYYEQLLARERELGDDRGQIWVMLITA